MIAFAASLESYDVEGAVAHYREHGYALLANVASESTLAALRARSDDIMQGRVTYPGLFYQMDSATGRYYDLEYGRGWEGPSPNYRKIEKLELDPIFLAWLDNTLFERIARAVIEGDVAIYRAVLFAKAARGGSELPWHQDAGKFWGIDRDPPLQIWTALDDAPILAGCVEVVPGSHAAGLVTPIGGVVPKVHVEAGRAAERAVAVAARAGDVMLIHNHLWHRSGSNATDHPRRAFTTCYMSAETRCMRTKRAPRVFPRVFTGR